MLNARSMAPEATKSKPEEQNQSLQRAETTRISHIKK
jgi:hypothetical protein